RTVHQRSTNDVAVARTTGEDVAVGEGHGAKGTSSTSSGARSRTGAVVHVEDEEFGEPLHRNTLLDRNSILDWLRETLIANRYKDPRLSTILEEVLAAFADLQDLMRRCEVRYATLAEEQRRAVALSTQLESRIQDYTTKVE
ncbi:unnamed protein product, partial [Amoebophrya sp. A25]